MTDHPDATALCAIDRIYAAAEEEALWPRALAAVAEATGADEAAFCTRGRDGAVGRTPVDGLCREMALGPEFLAALGFGDGMPRPRDAGEPAGSPDPAFGGMNGDGHVHWDWFDGLDAAGAGAKTGLRISRAAVNGPFSAAERARFNTLCGHMERAVAIAIRLGTFTNLTRAAFLSMERNPAAALLFDGKGRVLLASRAFHALSESGDGVILAEGRVRLLRPSDDRKLQKLLRNVAVASAAGKPVPGNAIAVARPSGRRPYVVSAEPVHAANNAALTSFRPAGCLLIADPERPIDVPLEKLCALHGLTRSEARLAVQLASGVDLRAAAEATGIAYATARSQLSVIFRKTGTGRQAELVRFLLSSSMMLAE